MDSKSRNCASCTRRGRKCEKRFHSLNEWAKLEKNEDKIKADIEQAERQLEQSILAQQELSHKQSQLLSKVQRLRRQQQLFKERGSKMLDHDTTVMDVLDDEDPESVPPATPPTEQQPPASAPLFPESEFLTLSPSDVEALLANPGLHSLGDPSFSFFADSPAMPPRPREGSR